MSSKDNLENLVRSGLKAEPPDRKEAESRRWRYGDSGCL